MAYTKTDWTPTTPINPSNLNKMEEGIRQNAADIENLNSNLDSIPKFVHSRIENSQNHNDLEYDSGCFITIPKHCSYVLFGSIMWRTGKPLIIALGTSTDATTYNAYEESNSIIYNPLTCNICGYTTDNDVTFYLFSKSENTNGYHSSVLFGYYI